MSLLLSALCFAITIYIVVLIVRIVLSWVQQVPEPIQPVARFVRQLTDPVLNPVRGLLPPLQVGQVALDLSPILVFLALSILRSLICVPAGTGSGAVS